MTATKLGTLTVAGLTDARNYCRHIAELLEPGDKVLLSGELATGKTTFVQMFASALGALGPVTSPTFGIAHFYNTPDRSTILHIDTYRLSGLAEFKDLGLDEYYPNSITFIEWGDMVAEHLTDYLLLELNRTIDNDDARLIHVFAKGQRWLDLYVKGSLKLENLGD